MVNTYLFCVIINSVHPEKIQMDSCEMFCIKAVQITRIRLGSGIVRDCVLTV